jgi:hypothetical protein
MGRDLPQLLLAHKREGDRFYTVSLFQYPFEGEGGSREANLGIWGVSPEEKEGSKRAMFEPRRTHADIERVFNGPSILNDNDY